MVHFKRPCRGGLRRFLKGKLGGGLTDQGKRVSGYRPRNRQARGEAQRGAGCLRPLRASQAPPGI
jgi:hypothetical protein